MKKKFSRIISLFICVVMVVSLFDFSFIYADDQIGSDQMDDGFCSVSAGELVYRKYNRDEPFTSAEHTYLASGYLYGDKTINYVEPSDPDLIHIDTVNKKITVDDYYDGYNNWYVVDPVTLYYDDGSEVVYLSDPYFAYSGLNYSVDAWYYYSDRLDTDIQTNMIKAPKMLSTLYKNVKLLTEATKLKSALVTLAANTYFLNGLANGFDRGGTVLKLGKAEQKAAAAYFLAQINQNGKTDLKVLLDSYTAGTSYTKFAYQNGDTLASLVSESAANLDLIATFAKNFGKTLSQLGLMTADEVAAIQNICTEGYSEVSSFAIADNYPNAKIYLKSNLTDEDYITLDGYAVAYISENENKDYSDLFVYDTLYVSTCIISKYISQANVTLNISANVINQKDSAETETLDYSKVLTFDIGTGKETILNSISNELSDKLDDWSEFDVGEENYTITKTNIDNLLSNGELTQSIVYDIEFTPKTVSITYSDGFNITETGVGTHYPLSVPYGYILTLTPNEDIAKAFDYYVNGEYKEELSLVVADGDKTISRIEGKSWDKKYAGLLGIACYDNDNADAEDILSNVEALDTPYIKLRTPDVDDNLVTIQRDGSNAKVTAESIDIAIGTNTYWTPVSVEVVGGDLDGNKYNFANGSDTLTIPCDDFDSLNVCYGVCLDNEFTKDEIQSSMNIPAQLVETGIKQKSAMDEMLANKDGIKSVDPIISNVRLFKFETPGAQQAVDTLMSNCVEGNHLICLGYIEDYEQNGLGAYYKIQNKDGMQLSNQIDLVLESLPKIVNDPTCRSLLRMVATQKGLTDEEDIEEYIDDNLGQVDEIETTLSEVQANLVQTLSCVNLDDYTTLKALGRSVESAIENEYDCEYTQNDISDSLMLYTNLNYENTLPQPAKQYSIKLNVYDKDNYVKASYPDAISQDDYTLSFDFGHIITENDLTAIENTLNNLMKVAGVDGHYEMCRENPMPSRGDIVFTSTVLTFSYKPKAYTVNFIENNTITGTQTIYFDNPKVALPSYENAISDQKCKYEYTINGVTYEQGKGYNYTKLMGVDNTAPIEIERRTVLVRKINYTTENLTFILDDIDNINTIRIAPGVYTTASEIKNAEGLVTLSTRIIDENTVDGQLRYTLSTGGIFSIWIKYNDGSVNGDQYILSGVDMTNMKPSISLYGLQCTIYNLYGVRDFTLAYGTGNTRRYCMDSANLIANLSGSRADANNSYKYTLPYSEEGVYSLFIRYQPGVRTDGIEYLYINNESASEGLVPGFKIDISRPHIQVNGLQVKVTDMVDVKTVRKAQGTWNTSSEVKKAPKYFAYARYDVKKQNPNMDSFMIQFGEQAVGDWTILVEYLNGYVEIFHVTVTKKIPTFDFGNSSITISNLDDFRIVRWAKGVSTNPKNLPKNKLIHPTEHDETLPFTIEDLHGTYTFLVQYNEQSQTVIQHTFD